MVGQQRQMVRFRWPIEPRHGWETAHLRFVLGLQKTPQKAEWSPASHAIDGMMLAGSHFLRYVPFYDKNGDHG